MTPLEQILAIVLLAGFLELMLYLLSVRCDRVLEHGRIVQVD